MIERMSDARNKRAAEIQDAIRHILYREWDPIGVRDEGTEDEYDSYIGGVYRILSSSRSEDDLIDFLGKVETEKMGFDPVPRDGLRPVARRLLSLDVSL